MVKILNRVLNTAKLPFDVCRGSAKFRNNLAGEYTKRFIQKMDEYSPQNSPLDIEVFQKCIDETISPYRIDYNVKREPEGSFCGTLKSLYKVMGDENGKICFVYNYGYDIFLRLDESGRYIRDKRTAVHETRHLFDHICNPKINGLRINEQFNNQSLDQISFDIIDMTLENKGLEQTKYPSIIKEYRKKLNEYFDKLNPAIRIELLQKLRYSLQTEVNAYNEEIKLVQRGGLKTLFKNFKNIYMYKKFLYTELCFPAKLKIVSKALKENLALQRSLNNS